MMRDTPLKKLRDDNKETLIQAENINHAIQKKRPIIKGHHGVDGAIGEVLTDEVDRWIRQRGRDLRLRQADRQHAVKLVNNLRKDLMKFLKDNVEQPFFRDFSVLNSGSYYELVKINKPNEFDIMLKLSTPRIMWNNQEKYKGLFYTVSLCRPPRGEIRAFVLQNGLIISASKIINEMHHLVIKFIKVHAVPPGEGRWVVCRKKVNSPAVTLVFLDKSKEEEMLSVDIVPALEVPQGWPEAARAGLRVENWLGKNVRRKFLEQPVYFVPKRPKTRNLTDAEKESWRISFSHIEKEMIRSHGNKKICCEKRENECCRKLCLRLLKCLVEGLKQTYPKELDSLCSYHGKTVFFHNLCKRPEDSLWTPGQLSVCFIRLFEDFEHAVNNGSLPHFFVPEHNLFSRTNFPKRSLQVLASALQEQKASGFPLLQLTDPVPALCYNSGFQNLAQQISPDPVTSTVTFKLPIMACAVIIFFAIICHFM